MTVVPRWVPVLITGLALAVLGAPAAQADRSFSLQHRTTAAGDIVLAGNTQLTCQATDADCATDQDEDPSGTGANNEHASRAVDVDADLSTVNSSSATLALPPTATVTFAGLYWGARSTAPARGTVKFRAPGDSDYRSLTASRVDTLTAPRARDYQATLDVTAIVKAAGAGAYTVADMALTTGAIDEDAGWALVVVYTDPSEPVRDLSVFDGYTRVSTAAPNVSIGLRGFQTPPLGPVRTVLGVVTYEGDRGRTGDSLRLASGVGAAAGPGTPLADALHPADDFFNSTIASKGTSVTSKDPDYRNQLGFDASTVRADGVLANGATSATIRLTTGGETYLPGVVTFATEIYAPRLITTKTIADLDGGQLQPGDTARITIAARNTGQDTALQTVVSDALPDGMTYVPGSLAVAGAPVTDAAGDDAGELDGTTVRARVGTGASAAAGGSVAPGAGLEVTFDVTVGATVASGTTLVNDALIDFVGEALGDPLQAGDRAQAIVRAPDLAITKSHAVGLTRGGTSSYTLTVDNLAGDAPSKGEVTVADTLPTGLSFTGDVAGDGWDCSVTGATVLCRRSDPLAAGGSYPAITIPVQVAADAPGALANSATVAGGGQAPGANDTATDTGPVTGPQADLALTITPDATQIDPGTQLGYTLTVTNAGPVAATGVTVRDTLPDGTTFVSADPGCSLEGITVTCEIGNVPVNATTSVRIVVSVPAGAAGSTLAAVATVTGDQDDPNAADNTDDAATEVGGLADLTLTKAIASGAGAGGTASYSLAVTNNGPAVARGVVIADPLPAGTTLVTAVPSAGTCRVEVTTVLCEVGDISPGNGQTLALVVSVAPSLAGTTLTNTATATATGPADPTPDDARASVSVVLGSSASSAGPPPSPTGDLKVTKTASGTFQALSPFTWTVTVTNGGTGPSQGVVLRDPLVAGTNLVSVTSSQGACSGVSVITCTLGDIAPGASVTIQIRATADQPGPVGNVATATSANEDPTPSDLVAGFSIDLAQAPASRVDAPSLETYCAANRLVLLEAARVGTRVRVSGAAGSIHRGERVSIVFRGTGKTVSRPTVGQDGRFSAFVALPAASVRDTNRARYQAKLGRQKSLDLKLARRMRTTTLRTTKGRVVFSGRVVAPWRSGAKTRVVIRRRVACGKYETVARVNADSKGNFRASIKAPSGTRAAVYRAQSQVPKNRTNPKLFPTFTLPQGVNITAG